MKEKLIRAWIPPLPQWFLGLFGRHGRTKMIVAHILGYDYGDADYIYQMRRRRKRKIFYIPTGEGGHAKLDAQQATELMWSEMNQDWPWPEPHTGPKHTYRKNFVPQITGLSYNPQAEDGDHVGDGKAVFVPLPDICAHPLQWCCHPTRDDCLPRGRVYYVMNPDVTHNNKTNAQIKWFAWKMWRLTFVWCFVHLFVWVKVGPVASCAVPPVYWFLLKRWYIGRNVTLKNGEKLNDRIVHQRFFYKLMKAHPWQAPVFYFLVAAYMHMGGLLMPTVNVAVALYGVVLKALLRPAYRARWRHILPADDAHWWGESQAFVDALPHACEALTTHSAHFWMQNAVVCQDIYHAYEAAWISGVQKTVFFFGLFLAGSYFASKYLVNQMFKDVGSNYVYCLIYAGVAFACFHLFQQTPTDVFGGSGRAHPKFG